MTDHETYLLLAAKQLSERLSEDEEVALTEHLASCPTCRATTNALRRDDILLRGELGSHTTVSPRVRRRVLAEAAGVRHFDRRLIIPIAATLLLGAVSIPLLAGVGRSEPSSPVPTLQPTLPPRSVAEVLPSVSVAPSPAATQSPTPSGLVPSLPAGGPYVAGAYVYGEGIRRRDTIAGHFEGAPVGEWSRTIPATGQGDFYGGPITCLLIEGKEAWIAGRATTATDGTKDRAVFMHVVDGGPDGAGDRAYLVLNTRGQSLTTMEEWCQRRFVPAPPYPLVSGDIVVDDGSG